MEQEIQMTQANIAISHKTLYCFFFVLVILCFAGCEEVSPYSYNCKNFNEEYLAKLTKNKDINSARELASLYAECNPEGEKKHKDLALKWSEKVMSFKEASENNLALYRALRNIDIDTGSLKDSGWQLAHSLAVRCMKAYM